MPDKPKVLLIGNGVDPQGNLLPLLMHRGFEIASVPTGQEAASFFRNFDPDIVLIEYELPDSNGIEILSQLKTIRPSTPMIMLSGFAFIDMGAEAVKAGAEHFLTKKSRPETLSTIMERCIETERTRRKRLSERLTLKEVERRYIEEVLRDENGRVEITARRLGIPRSSLYHKLKTYRVAEQQRRAG